MSRKVIRKVGVIDSHTGGEPTRVIVSGAPNLMGETIAEKLADFRDNHDDFRHATINEPRGSDILVGALLLPPTTRTAVVGVIFFNNVGTLGMCGHGLIGLMRTLAYLDLVAPGVHSVETPVGTVRATLHTDGSVSVRNVPAYRHAKGVQVTIENSDQSKRVITGDVAWGGNWFFLVTSGVSEPLELTNVETLTDLTWKIREALTAQGITGKDGAEIDHIELFAPSKQAGVNSKNFVLCPGKAYDRSPCGTGTSAKLACLYADGKLAPGELWRQESITESIFEGSIEVLNGEVIPTIRGTAFLTAETTLLFEEEDLSTD